MTNAAGAPRELGKELAGASFPELERLLATVSAKQHAAAGNLWGSAQAFVLARVAERAAGPWIAVTASDAEAEAFVDDLGAFGARATWLPARDPHGKSGAAHADLDLVRRRLQVAQLIGGTAERRPKLVVASLLSLLQPLPSPGDLERDYLGLQTGQKLDAEALLERLVAAGYARQPLAERPGEVSLRGEILDLYAFAAELRKTLTPKELDGFRADLLRYAKTVAEASGGILGIVFCPILAPAAWVMGNTALQEIDAQPGRYSNRGVVQAGRLCGMIYSLFLIALLLLGGVLLVVLAIAAGSSSSA